MSEPDQAGAGGSWSDNSFWLTERLQSDVTVLRAAGELYAGSRDADTGALAARRSLDRQLRTMTGWPHPEDYEAMAVDYEAAGRAGEATLLRQVAATRELQAEARYRWNHRYTDRPASTADEMITTMADGGMIDFDPEGPYRGLDGAGYRPGMLTIADLDTPVMVVASRGGLDLAVDWADYAAMSAWLADRGSSATGPLQAPPTPEGHRFRPWQEEQILARMLEAPGEVPALAPWLPPDRFTADLRYDVYAAILAVAGEGERPTPDRVAAEMASRLAWVPDHALPLYGGPDGQTAQAYLSRLAATPVRSDEATQAARALHQEDTRNRARGLTRSPEQAEDPGPKPRHVPEQASWLALAKQATPDTTAMPVPATVQGPRPAVGPVVAVDPGLRPPEQPQPGGPAPRL